MYCGHRAIDSYLIPLIVRHCQSSFLLRHVLDFHFRGHDMFDSFLIPLIVEHGPRSFLLRHVIDSHIRVDMTGLIPSLSLLSLSFSDMAQGPSFLDMS
jgi:hypothetical protein